MVRMRLFACWLAATLAMLAADNTLTPEEGRAGWTLLFDGRSFRGWQDPAKQNLPGDAWAIENGTLKTRVKPRIREDLLTDPRFALREARLAHRSELNALIEPPRAICCPPAPVTTPV